MDRFKRKDQNSRNQSNKLGRTKKSEETKEDCRDPRRSKFPGSSETMSKYKQAQY